jgi:hypothetical protein
LNGNIDDAKDDKEFSVEGGDMETQRPCRNKTKNPLTRICEISDTMKIPVLEVPSGFDIIDILETFMHTFHLRVIVIGGRGYVTNINLRSSITIGWIVYHIGVFEIVSLTGAFPRDARTQGGTRLKVSLTDAWDNYVRGIVGILMAYDETHVIVGVVMDINSEEFNVQPMQPPGLFLPPAAMATQQHFQTPMTVQQ